MPILHFIIFEVFHYGNDISNDKLQESGELEEGEQQVHPEEHADAAAGAQGAAEGAAVVTPAHQVALLLLAAAGDQQRPRRTWIQ